MASFLAPLTEVHIQLETGLASICDICKHAVHVVLSYSLHDAHVSHVHYYGPYVQRAGSRCLDTPDHQIGYSKGPWEWIRT